MFWRLIVGLGTLVGVATGIGTIVGWIVSSASIGHTAVTALEIAGIVYVVGSSGVVAWAILGSTYKEASRALLVIVALLAMLFVGYSLWAYPPSRWQFVAAGGVAIALGTTLPIIYVLSLERARKKTCPDCAETVKAGARVCHYCGFRFATRPLPASYPGRMRPR